MNIFMTKKSCEVTKIEPTTDGWMLYPLDKKAKPVFISNKNYAGKMPPFIKWPWQKLKLEVTEVLDFQVAAVLNGVTLIEIKDVDYPPEIKEKIEKRRRHLQEIKLEDQQEDEEIKAALVEYLQKMPVKKVALLENDLSNLKVCLRVFLQLHCFRGQGDKHHLARLNLMLKLAEMVQRIYYRRVDEKSFLGTSEGCFWYSFFRVFNRIYDYHAAINMLEKREKDSLIDEGVTAWDDYSEVDKLLDDWLDVPVENLKLRVYLNYVVMEVTYLFAYDNNELLYHLSKDAWGRRWLTDEQEYKQKYHKMKMLKYSSFVLPEVLADEVIVNYICQSSLK